MSSVEKSYYIKTFGCYANEADSDLIAGVLEKAGFKELKKKNGNETQEISHALKNSDILIVNSCSVRQKSEDKVYGLGKMIKHGVKNRAKVFLTGCMVGSAVGDRKRFTEKELQRKTESYDGYFPPADISKLTELLKKFDLISENFVLDKNSVQRRQVDKKHAFVNVSYGCDNFCSYCVVPYSRGCEISRAEKEIIDEIKCLVEKGISEITLCGQNVNSWGLSVEDKMKIRLGSVSNGLGKKTPFAVLVEKVHKISGIEKIDFISSNPFDFTQDIVNLFKLHKIANYVHIAVQSGNNDILKMMNRKHTSEEFLDLVKSLRTVRPDIEIGTDIIVGFPGETREQFMDTVKLVKDVKFSVAFIAMYSPRKGTYAQVNLKDNVSMKEKKWRHMYLSKVWKNSKPKNSGSIYYHSRWEEKD